MFLANGDLAWLAMARPGFEADRLQVMLRDARSGATRALTPDWDRSVRRLAASHDGRRLLAAPAVAKYDWLDGERACSLGASYGGFMQSWIAGNWPERFKCLVNRAGIFDLRTMYYTTEELWFSDWENGGPYHLAPQSHEKFNPANHVTKWRTPTLVIQGMRDCRVPHAQSLGIFTARQRQGVPARLLVFPDENHWILKPANSLQWHEAVLGWAGLGWAGWTST